MKKVVALTLIIIGTVLTLLFGYIYIGNWPDSSPLNIFYIGISLILIYKSFIWLEILNGHIKEDEPQKMNPTFFKVLMILLIVGVIHSIVNTIILLIN